MLLKRLILLSLMLMLPLAACTTRPTPVAPTVALQPTATVAPTVAPTATVETTEPPAAVEYNLGDTTIVQARFPEDSRFRNMPVRLNGLIAAPSGQGRTYPVVVVLHGNHPGCPLDETNVDRWPCDPQVEQPNYRGFEYLIRQLAARGYVALSININAENTFGFGEPTPGERLQQFLDLHLKALAEAAAGGVNQFGVDLKGRVDLSRLAFLGHSRGGEAIYALANDPQWNTVDRSYGPIAGVELIAAAIVTVDPAAGSTVPMTIILPACDGDVNTQDGQHFYEGARLASQQTQWATSVWLEQANHNYFNEILADESMGRGDRPDCKTLLTPIAQRNFLVDYTTDFLTTLFSTDAQAKRAAEARLGMDAQTLAPNELYGLPARVANLTAQADRRTLFIPSEAGELKINRLGDRVTAEGVTTFFCPEGFYTPVMKPGSEPCRRVNVTIPGQPALVVVSWPKSGGALRLALPEGQRDLADFTTISLRAALDPLSSLNAVDQAQAFTVKVTDGAGKTAVVSTRPAEPALQYPPGTVADDSFFAGGLFTGIVHLTTVRLPLKDFAGINLHDVREIAVVFDQTASGSLFMGDVEIVRSPQ